MGMEWTGDPEVDARRPIEGNAETGDVPLRTIVRVAGETGVEHLYVRGMPIRGAREIVAAEREHGTDAVVEEVAAAFKQSPRRYARRWEADLVATRPCQVCGEPYGDEQEAAPDA